MLKRRPIVGLTGGGDKLSPERIKLAHDVGAMIGGLGANLLMSASYAVAQAAADGFASVPQPRGISFGDIARDPAGLLDKKSCADDGTPFSSRFVELAMFTRVETLDKPRTQERSRVNLLTCDAIVALPGGAGTRVDVDAAAREHARPAIVLVGPAEEFGADLRSAFLHASDAAAAEARLCRELASRGFMLVKRGQAAPA